MQEKDYGKRQLIMKTLIELYDERAVENVLGPETFHPETVIYLYPPESGPDRNRQRKMREYFRYRGIDAGIIFEECSVYRADRILAQLNRIYDRFADIAVDVTGGTDAALFAAGMFSAEKGVPAFTYSRKKNSFYDISGASFADGRVCDIRYTVDDIFRMAGGHLRTGRVDNSILSDYMDTFEPFFHVYMKHRRKWTSFITYVQRISKADCEGRYAQKAEGAYTQKGDNGGRVSAEPALLRDLERIGYIRNLYIDPDKYVSFEFRDENIRAWLRDVGSVLELYIYKMCVDTMIFQDVVSSAVVDWDDAGGRDCVSNEIDVVATRGILPVFISCKTCDVRTEALNELAVLRDRFGGKAAKAVIVTAGLCNSAARHRAAQLGIAVIDREELSDESVKKRLKVIMKVRNSI